MTKVSAYTRSDGRVVSGYERGKPDPEDGTGVEVPTIAPKGGTDAHSIVSVPKPGEPRPAQRSGVTIMGGSSHGQRTPNVVQRKH